MSDISIIHGYGVFVAPNPKYQKYLDDCFKGAQKLSSDKIIVCGGYTNPKIPELSESQSIIDYYTQNYPQSQNLFIAENQSLTTPENLLNASKIIQKLTSPPVNINIFCDYIRSPKIFYLALTLFHPDLSSEDKLLIIQDIVHTGGQQLTYKNIKIFGIRLSDTVEMAEHQILSTLLEIHYFEYPALHQRFIDYRKQKWGIK